MNPAHLQHSIDGASSIGELFAAFFRHATQHLAGTDVAKLLHASIGDIGALGWIVPNTQRTLAERVDTWALRDEDDRLRIRKPERDAFIEALGGIDIVAEPRMAFVVAQAIDARYATISPRIEPSRGRAVAEVPPAFLADATNLPPRIGQMTPLAACRRWMTAFHYVGDVHNLDAFGLLPLPRPQPLPNRTLEALSTAGADGQLRIAAVSWRRHETAALAQLPASPGCFAIAGLPEEPTAAELASVLSVLRQSRPHVVVFPEVSFSSTAFATLRGLLAAPRERFPSLVVVGHAHRPNGGGTHDNVGVVLDAGGKVLLEHHKIEPYENEGLLEDILPRSVDDYPYLDTPVGRIVVNVCRDFRSDIPMVMNRALAATLIVVPTYSNGLEFVVEEARILGARQLAIVVAANPPALGLRHAAAFYAPIRGRDASVLANLPVPNSGLGTVHAFTISLADGVHAKLDAHDPVAL